MIGRIVAQHGREMGHPCGGIAGPEQIFCLLKFQQPYRIGQAKIRRPQIPIGRL